MRRFLLFFLGVLCLLCPVRGDIRYALSPVGFEDGTLPPGWTQEHITGTVDWQAEGGSGVSLTNPAGAKKGDYRLGIRRATGATTGFVTRLVLPAVDVTSMINPQLCFAHAQVASFDYFDTLRVYYRPNATTDWAVLAEYNAPISTWTSETIALEKYLQGTAYQIAFEVSDHAGKGVVLDEICIMQPSQCQMPQFQMIQAGSNNAYIEFVSGGTGYGSTADLFDVIVSDSALADPSVAQASEVEYMQRGMSDNYVNISGLNSYTTYYVYLRTNCADNESGYTDWAQTTFETTMLRSLPYTENFNLKRGTSDYATPAGWTFGTNIADAKIPYVYVGTTSSYKQYYSVDSTSYLAFTGNASTSVTPIGQGSYVYAATPELDGNLQECEVSFWGTAYQYVYNGVKDYAAELTVGVMTDPTDYTTFTAIKTVNIESAYQFKHFIVSLSGYNGTGRYVALCSAADKDNVFFVDNFSVSRRTTTVPEDVRVYNVLPTGFDVSVTIADADSWNIRISEKYVRDGGMLSAADCIIEQSGNTAAACHISSDAIAGKTVKVYAQAVKNGVASAWSFPVTLRIPTEGVVPIKLTMNSGNYTSINLKTLNNEIHGHSSETAIGDVYFPLRAMEYIYPAISSSSPTYDGGHLNLNGIDNYFVLPYIESLDSLMISFRLSVGSSYSSYAEQSRVAVGVMTDPYDLSTFVELGRFDGTIGSYLRCEQELTAYTGAGHYVAIRALEPAVANSTYASYNAIDDILLKKIPTCRAPRNISAIPTTTTAAISWDASGMQKWVVSWYENNNVTGAAHDTVVTNPSVLLNNLKELTTYYYTVRTICGEDTIEAEEILNFTTLRGIPFKETFTTTSLPSGWRRYKGLLSSVFNGSSLTSVSSYWNFGSNMGGVTTNGYTAYIDVWDTDHYYWLMLPELYINEDANARLSFDVAFAPYNGKFDLTKRNTGIDDQFAVVISTDGGKTWKREDATIWNNANDSTTDYVLNDLPMQMQKTFIDLNKYKGQSICIAFYTESTVSNADNYLLIDNVEVSEYDENCQGISRFACTPAGADKGIVEWTAGGMQSVHMDMYADGETAKVFSGDITISPYTITGLKDNTVYYVEAYQSCNAQGDTIRTNFRTNCGLKTPADLGTMDFADVNSLLCWTVGIGDTTGVGDRTLTEPSAKSITYFGRVLYLAKPKGTSYNYGNNYYAILPPLDIDSITRYQVVFDAATNTLPSDTTDMRQLFIGVITDPTDLSTFEITDTLTLQYAADSMQMKSYAIGFDKYKGDYLGDYGKYIVFMASAPSSYSDVALIDNVRIEAVSACHQILDMSATDLTPNTATLRWTNDAEKARIVVSSVLCTPDTMSSFVFDAEADGHSIGISGLNGNTTYYAYAKAICSEGDSARWSGHTIFTTTFGVPYNEDFNAKSLSTDWKGYQVSFSKSDTLSLVGKQQSTSTTSWYMANVPTSIAGMNGYAARVEVYGYGGYDALLVSPSIYLPTIEDEEQSLAVSFKVAKATYSGNKPVDDSEDDKLSVMVSTDGGHIWTRSNSVVWASDGTGDYDYNAITLAAKRYKVDLSAYMGQQVNIGFFTESTTYAPDTYLYIDSVSVDYYTPVCDGVSNIVVMADSTTYQSASTVCKLPYKADQIEYVYGKDSVDWTTAEVHRTNSAQICLSGLAAGSLYAVYARTLCEGGDTSAWFGPKYFETKCLATIPVVYDFDDQSHRYKVYSTYEMDNCWDVVYSSTSYIPHIVNNSASSTYAYSGSSALYMPMTTSSKNYSVAALPTIDADLDTLQLSFMARAGYLYSNSMSSATASNLHSVMIGTMNDLKDTATFRLIKEVVLEPIEANANPANDATAFWRQQVVSLEGAKGKYLVFMQKNGSKYNYIYIDDVRLSKRIDCPMVENLSIDSITDVSASIHWTSQSGKFAVSLSSPTDERSMIVSDTVYTLTALKPNTVYTLSVAAVCGTDTTLAIHKSFTTYCSIPFSESFADGLPADWKRMSGNILNGGSATTSYSGWLSSTTNAYGINAPKMMWELTNEDYDDDYGYEYYEQNSVLTTPNIVVNAPESTPVLLSFDMALTSSSSSYKPSSSSTKERKFAILVSEDHGETWIKIDSLVWGTDTTYARRFDSIPNTATRYEFDFSAYKGKAIRIAFYAYSPDNDASGYLHLTNVSLKELNLNCLKPTATTVKDITLDGATFSWHGSAASYEIEVASDRKFSTLLVDTIVSDTTFTITSLVPSTLYYTRVRAVCGEDGNSDWSDVLDWKTLYGVPFIEEFDDIATAFPDDWKRYKGVTLSSVLSATSPFAGAATSTNWGYSSLYSGYALTDEAHTGIEMYSSFSNNWMLTPMIDLSSVVAPHIVFSFDAALTHWSSAAAPTATTNQRFYMIVSEDGGKTWNKENLTTWSDMSADSARYTLASIPNGNGIHYQFDFSKYIGKSIQIAFGINATSNDNRLHIDNIRLEEIQSVCWAVEDVVIKSKTSTSLSMCIVPVSKDSLWQYAYGKSGFVLVDSVALHNTSDKEFTLNHLEANTSYDIYVRSICSVGDTSAWVGPYTAKTAIVLPLVEEFDSIATAFPADWERYKDVPLSSVLSIHSPFAEAATTTYWEYSSVYNANALSDDAHIGIEMYSTRTNNWLLTPVIDLSSADAPYLVFSFDAALTYWNSAAAPTSTTSQRFYMIVSEDGGATWNKENLTTWSDMPTDSARYTLASIPTGTGNHYKFDFSKYLGKNIQVAFGINATSNDNRLHIDNIRLEAAQSICLGVEDLSVKSVRANSVAVSIQPGKSDSIWQYVYGISGFAITDSVPHTTSDTAFVLNRLLPDTLYDIYARSICNVGDTSEWSKALTFATGKVLPYIESFSTVNISSPEGWTFYSGVAPTTLFNGGSFANATTTTSGWMYSTSYNAYAMSDTLHLSAAVSSSYYSTGSRYWAVTPVVEMIGAPDTADIILSFDLAMTGSYNASSPADGSLKPKFYVAVSADGGLSWKEANATLWSDDAADNARYTLSEIPNGTGTTYIINMTRYAGQQVQIAFGGIGEDMTYSNPTNVRFHLDNVRLQATTSYCFDINRVDLIEATPVSLTLSAEVDSRRATRWQYVYGVSGFARADSLVHTTTQPQFTLSNLRSGTRYDVYVRSICSTGDTTAWVGPTTFCTAFNLPFEEDFSTIASQNIPKIWTTYRSIAAADLLTGTKSFATEECYIPDSLTIYWGYNSNNQNALTDNDHISVEIHNSLYNGLWLLSPIVSIPAISEGEKVVFSFDAALTHYSSNEAPKSTDNQRFYVLVSDDCGATWNKKNAMVWSNAAADSAQYRMADMLTGNGQNYMFDFSKYAGKNIRITFGVEATANDNRLHIDNINLYSASSICVADSKLSLTDKSTSSLSLLIDTQNNKHQWQYAYDRSGFILSDATPVHLTATPGFTIDQLSASTAYDVYIRTLCGEGDTSKWVGPYQFKTVCGVPYLEEFDQITTKGLSTDWKRYKKITSSSLFAGSVSFATEETSDESYGNWSSSNSKYALQDEQHITVELWSSYSGTWLLSPVLDLTTVSAEAKLQFSFDAALTYYSSADAPKSSDDQNFYVLVSEDEGVTWSKNNSTLWSNASADTAQYRMDDILTGAGTHYAFDFSKYIGKKICIAFGVEATANDNRIHLDNIALDTVSSICSNVYRIHSTSITSKSLTIAFESKEALQWQYAYGVEGFSMSDKTPLHTIDTTQFTIAGLAANSQYDVYVRSICAVGDTSAWVGPRTFATLQELPFYEPFDDMATIKSAPEGWTRYKSIVYDDLISGKKAFANSEPYTYQNSYEDSWGYYSSYANNAFADENHISIKMSSTYSDAWLVSPMLDMTMLADTQQVILSFDAALTYYNSAAAPYSTSDQSFYVVVSEDGGNSWTEANTTTWSDNDSAQYRLGDIPTGNGATYDISLSKYVGKIIQIAFGTDVTANSNRLYLDNVAVHTLVSHDYAASICNSTDYQDRYFSIQQSELQLGETQYTKKLSGINGAADTVVTLTLDVYPAVRVALYDTICQGYAYSQNGFDLIANASAVVPMVLTSANGCDSLVELHLEVIPATYLDTTIMACQSYTHNGTTYYSDKVLTDTLSSSLGCDSIVRTFLHISAQGDTETEWRTTICSGDTYSDEVFAGLNRTGVYTQTVQTAYGCDSTVTLYLLIADEQKAVYDTILQSDLPYIFEGETFLGANTKVGDYQHDIQSSCGQVTLYMHVYSETAIANTSVHSLYLTPNPAKVGVPIRIVSDFSASHEYMLSVFSSVGQLVYRSDSPVDNLPGLSVAGIYTVRIVADGKVFQTQLLVR